MGTLNDENYKKITQEERNQIENWAESYKKNDMN
jgi:hypothetical protein